eukprot:CAMPEP_0201549234 /NCGR_PEP_ID=MMETSP0173_2-20130828/5722_1 /ASSEMBLY_ACC=CAM_ASM_000268 /TAXON_ID=218659 /ORGANISM="Vexillifera sp., Strain DIVA3 564/2" /LENGTH=123 /DNA_ID=CAMNT_0047958843 /DNA_START=394 /DNA_END=765 /DNA_ORIENTATION=+
MVIIFGMRATSFWLKEEITGGQFKDNACHGPEIDGCRIVTAGDDFWSAILPGLDITCEMLVNPACVAEISNFYLDLFESVKISPETFVAWYSLGHIKVGFVRAGYEQNIFGLEVSMNDFTARM